MLVSKTVFTLVFFIMAFAPPCLAQPGEKEAEPTPDSATIRSKSGGKITLHGRVVDYNGQYLIFKVPSSNSNQVHRSEFVIRVTTPQSADHIRGRELYEARQIREAEVQLEQAFANEPRAWVRRQIQALMVRAAMHRDDLLTAGMRFIELSRKDPNTTHFNLIPLIWASREMPALWQEHAKVWLSYDEDIPRLLGASFLLDSPTMRGFADGELRKLSISANTRVAKLAHAQRWRTTLASGKLNELELKRWESTIETIPKDVRGGAHYLVARGLVQHRHFERAATSFLWVSLVYADDHHLAARACVEAADALRRVGQTAHARRLYEEAASRFGDTTFAQDARSALFELKDDADASGR
ncbi:MAG: hypothetical protein O3A00_03795 [Planctomycetota bacterium]|nr:hypothetical protein [Planctomycetota bacterium]